MGTRLALQSLLESALGSGNVYFQPPPGYALKYPCIIFERSRIQSQFADGRPYRNEKQYTVTVIDANPDSATPDKIKDLPKCIFDRHYTADNLNHDVFNIYF